MTNQFHWILIRVSILFLNLSLNFFQYIVKIDPVSKILSKEIEYNFF
jgi:hypothetical protein